MKVWPNWVDLVIVSLVFITCYRGYWRGLLAELFNLAGALTITSVTLNYHRVVAQRVPLSSWISKMAANVVLFWALFLLLWWIVRLIRQRLATVMKWERLHWIIQSAGLVCGGLRGLWWAGFIMVVFSSSGFIYLRQSVEERSLLGRPLLRFSREALAQAADRFPGAMSRGADLVPPVKPSAE